MDSKFSDINCACLQTTRGLPDVLVALFDNNIVKGVISMVRSTTLERNSTLIWLENTWAQ